MSSDPLRDLGAHVADRQAPLLARDDSSEATRRQLVERVLARAGARRRASGARRHWLALAAGVALLACGLLLGNWLQQPPAPLSFTIGAEPGVLQSLTRAPADAALPLRFSDGSSVELAPSAQARVVSLGADGADVVLESGRTRVDVVPRRAGQPARWQFRSGPFAVQVKGTSFWLGWDREREAFSLDLLSGEVLVTGCGLGDGRELRAGERLEASCREPAPTAAPLPATEPAVGAAPATPDAGPRAPASRARSHDVVEPHVAWQLLARQGDFPGAYALAAETGWPRQVAAAGREDLLLLGQSARLTGHVDDAAQAYAEVRRRFAGSAAAARAAYALGLLAFESDPRRASEWLEIYLAEQPRGPLAEPALERLLEASLRQSDAPRRRDIARRYLEQSPRGPHAAEARRVLEASSPVE
ncbi:MAG TPA: FecR domain-containing protein [Polyangiaceae bacterium]|nr:FecR domain-containing protein [Polyangiaceae bacterium]